MSKPLITTSEDTTIEEAGAIMTGKSVKRLPVLNHRRLSGMITATDIVRKEPVLVRLFDDLAKSKDNTSSKS
jgi:CBS domain-containing protein